MNRKTCLGHCVWFIQSLLPCCYYIWFSFSDVLHCVDSVPEVFHPEVLRLLVALHISTLELRKCHLNFFSSSLLHCWHVSMIECILRIGGCERENDGEKQSDQSSVLRSRRKLIRMIDSLISSSARLQSTYQWTSTLTTWWCSQSSPIVRFSPWPSPSTRLSKFSRHPHWSHPPRESPLLPKRVNFSATSKRTLTSHFSVFLIWSNMLNFFSECLPF